MRIAREGYPFVFVPGVLSFLLLISGWTWFAVGLGFVAIALAGFFRDPKRTPPTEDNLIVSPADGKVVAVSRTQIGESPNEEGTRVSIFLSPLDVHINRTPVEGLVDEVRYRPGKFFAAYKEDASSKNEQNAVRLVDGQGRKFGVVQVAGVMARRIVCHVKKGDSLGRGERFGLIMFGSRTDLLLPTDARVEVVEGQRVKGGETVIGRFQ